MPVDDYAHELKTWPRYFESCWESKKKFEIRSTSDRKFEEGQHILLREYDPHTEQYTGRWLHVQVTYVTDPECPFLLNEHCVFGFVIITRGE